MKKLYSIYACITTLILTTNITFSQIKYANKGLKIHPNAKSGSYFTEHMNDKPST
jgi:hypothetical protein